MKIQLVRSRGNCAYPPIGKYTTNSAFKKDFKDIEISQDNFTPGPIRPEGNRQPEAEAAVLSNLKARAQGRAAFPDADVWYGGRK